MVGGGQAGRQAGWHDNLQQAGDLVAMATHKDVCIAGKSQRLAAEGHSRRSTNRSGGWWRATDEANQRNAFILSLGFPSQSLVHSTVWWRRRGGGVVPV